MFSLDRLVCNLAHVSSCSLSCLSVQVYDSLVEATKDIDGATVENNKFCVSVHYRNVDGEVTLYSASFHTHWKAMWWPWLRF